MKKVVPLAVIYAFFTVSGSICLYFSRIWYYQLARAFTPLFVVSLVFVLFRSKPLKSIAIPCVVIITGFIFASINGNGREITKKHSENYVYGLFGIFCGIASAAFSALYSINLKKAIETIKCQEWY